MAPQTPHSLGTPSDWEYLAQGGANVVFHRSSTAFQDGWLLRVPKQPPVRDRGALDVEELVWAPMLRTTSCTSLQSLDEQYIPLIMGRYIGKQYLPEQVWASAPQGFLPELWQRSGLSSAAPNVPSVALVRDARHLSSVAPSAPSVVSFEIKPKWGATSACPTALPEHAAAKSSTSRYRMHQQLKRRRDEVQRVSAYDPLDLFSGVASRVAAALRALGDDPQNNFAAGLDGVAVGLEGAAAAMFPEAQGVLGAVDAAVDALARILLREDLLPQLLAAQTACRMDIQGVHALLCTLADGRGESGCPDADSDCLGRRSAAAAATVRDYLISCTARDCAVIVALQRCPVPGPGSGRQGPGEAGALELGDGAVLLYRLTIIDLDRKAVSKIPAHLALDAAIMEAVLTAQG